VATVLHWRNTAVHAIMGDGGLFPQHDGGFDERVGRGVVWRSRHGGCYQWGSSSIIEGRLRRRASGDQVVVCGGDWSLLDRSRSEAEQMAGSAEEARSATDVVPRFGLQMTSRKGVGDRAAGQT
jgi:hypothetical protein